LIRAVLDTNVLVSGILGMSLHSESAPSLVLRRWANDQFDLVISDHILGEVRRTLAKPWFSDRLTPADVDAVLTPMVRSSVYVVVRDIGFVPAIATHPEDDLVLATVDAANADVLVTGDAMLLKLAAHHRASILNARQFLEMLQEG
jgi:putative PIN family toxin of toxin-antitoxin system